ncbi:hypothetical protein Acr_17g0003490 [Actinidia rufa]|uniref:hAT-like transposase RNase-H fold domain-containing protein n=1 Tax=Actinidia rufa TaxID=165716 RepID=A0A7J0G1W1_9ERIC|nr:hypothetical protein Acr_17g0003490 [Actinidia rufa]
MDSYMIDFSISAKRPNVDFVEEVDDVEEGNPNPTLGVIDVIDIVEEDDMVANVDNIGDKSVKRKLPPQPKGNGPKEPNKKVKEDEDEYVVEDWEDEDASRVPTKLDWKNCKLFVTFLKLFYDATKRFSGSLFVTSNSVFDEILKIEATLEKLLDNKDPFMCAMAARMKEKFLRYWGDGGKINVNIYIYVAVALDPRLKLRWLRFRYTKFKGKDVGINMESRVKAVLVRLYDAYAIDSQSRIQVRSESETPSVRVEEDCDYQSSLHSEFDTYLEEEYSSVYESMDKVEDLEREILQPDDASSEVRSDRSDGNKD